MRIQQRPSTFIGGLSEGSTWTTATSQSRRRFFATSMNGKGRIFPSVRSPDCLQQVIVDGRAGTSPVVLQSDEEKPGFPVPGEVVGERADRLTELVETGCGRGELHTVALTALDPRNQLRVAQQASSPSAPMPRHAPFFEQLHQVGHGLVAHAPVAAQNVGHANRFDLQDAFGGRPPIGHQLRNRPASKLDVLRIVLDADAPVTDGLGGRQCRAGAAKRVENHPLAQGQNPGRTPRTSCRRKSCGFRLGWGAT